MKSIKKMLSLATSVVIAWTFVNTFPTYSVSNRESKSTESTDTVNGEKFSPQRNVDVLGKDDFPEVIDYSIACDKNHINRIKDDEKLNTIVFENVDGTHSEYVFDHPVKYYDDDGEQKDISLRLKESVEDNGYIPVSSGVEATFDYSLSNGVKIDIADAVITMIPVFIDTQNTEVSLDYDQRSILYSVDEKTSIEYSMMYQGIKENIIISDHSEISAFDFVLRTNGLRLDYSDDVLALFDDEGNIVAHFEDIISYDSNNVISNGEISYDVISENSEYVLSVIVDEQFMSDPNTVYPVYIDPTVIIDYSPTTFNNEYTISHATVYDNDTYSGNSTMYIGNVNGAKARVLMRFPGFAENNIYDFSYLNSAKLYMTATGYNPNNHTFDITCYNPTYNWSMNSLPSWYYYGSDNSYNSTSICSKSVSSSIGASLTPSNVYEFDITSLFGVGFDFTKGLLIRADSATENQNNNYCSFGSYSNQSYSPYVVLDFNTPADYVYANDAPLSYTYYHRVLLTSGNTYIFETDNATHYTNCDTELFLFDESMNPSNSWYNDDISSSSPINRYSRIVADITETRYYILLVKVYSSAVYTGSVSSGHCNVYQVDPQTNERYLIKEDAQLGGYQLSLYGQTVLSQMPFYNTFTTDISNNGDTMMVLVGKDFLINNNQKVVGYNDDYSNSSSNFNWGRSSRIKQHYDYGRELYYAFVFSYYSTGNYTTDIYALCGTYHNPHDEASIQNNFPNYALDDYIVAAEPSNDYNCIAYSGGITYLWLKLGLNGTNPDVLCPWYSSNEYTTLDNFYGNNPPRYLGAMSYTSTLNSADAVVNLYKKGNDWTHASVRAPGNAQPHGYAWESKLGQNYRVFHPVDALDNADYYGSVARMYKVDNRSQTNTGADITFEESIRLGLTQVAKTDVDNERIIIDKKIQNASEGLCDLYYDYYYKWVESIENNPQNEYASLIDYTDSIYFEELSDLVDNNDELVYTIISDYLYNPSNRYKTFLFSSKVVCKDETTLSLASIIREENNSISINSLKDGVYIAPSFENNSYCFIKELLERKII